MIVLDTNVVSEMMRPSPDPSVLAWLDAQHRAELHITAITAAELIYGVERMPAGNRRTRTAYAIADVLDLDFPRRILPFDSSAAIEYGRIVAQRQRRGRPIGMADGMIAAIGNSVGAALLVTRNTRDFDDIGIPLLDPWDSPPAA